MLIDAKCEVRGDKATQAADRRVKAATEEDWSTEYLDAIIAVKVVDGVAAAIDHIERYGSHHTDAIITKDKAAADTFLCEVDSAIVLHNASTQFADGGEFGFGAEIGIASLLAVQEKGSELPFAVVHREKGAAVGMTRDPIQLLGRHPGRGFRLSRDRGVGLLGRAGG